MTVKTWAGSGLQGERIERMKRVDLVERIDRFDRLNWTVFSYFSTGWGPATLLSCVLGCGVLGCGVLQAQQVGAAAAAQHEIKPVMLRGDAGGKRFDGIGIVDGGGGTSVLLKDYPEEQRRQILDMVFKPKFGASVSALLVEIPGDGNATQGSMPSHMHTRDDLNYHRGYMWWILAEAKKRNPKLTLDGTGWSAPAWVGNGQFFSQDGADYYIKWLQGLRNVYGLEFDAIGCRNEKGTSYEFAETLRASLDTNGFKKVKLHCFDNWPTDQFDFVQAMTTDAKLRGAIDILGGHTLTAIPLETAAAVRQKAASMDKPIWNTEEHVYKEGFDDEISIVEAFNENFIRIGATRIVNWYDIAALYPMEPYSETPAMLLARSPWSGHYQVREALWGYAHYGQFSEAGWEYLNGGSRKLDGGGDFVTLKSPGKDYSIILQTKGAKAAQQVRFQVGGGLSPGALCVWRSDKQAQFIQQPDVTPVNGNVVLTLEPDAIYSLSTTRGQKKGGFDDIPAPKPFPLPYSETFDQYAAPERWGYLPRYTADIADVFEIVPSPGGGKGKSLRQVVATRPNAWAPEWLPYTILGDEQWADYEVSADIYLNAGDAAGVMGRINHVGWGYGSIPKGYFLDLDSEGICRLVAIRGKVEKAAVVGDAEQQALIKKQNDLSEGGEKILGKMRLEGVKPGQWHRLTLRFQGTAISGLVDGKPVVSATDSLYPRGMAGLLAGGGEQKLSTPYYDNVLVNRLNTPAPGATKALEGQTPIYGTLK